MRRARVAERRVQHASSIMAPDRLIIFAKPPKPGAVKTRLVPPLSEREAAEVYEASLRDVIALAARERGRVELWFPGGDAAGDYFAREFPHLLRRPQADGSLGDRLADAFARSFTEAADRVVAIGGDSPTLPDTTLTAAFHDLQEADTVLGPALDGGYYLVGLRADAWPRARQLFTGVPWSSPGVWEATLARAEQAALDVRILPGWYDLDRIEDLQRVRQHALPESHIGRWLAGPGARFGEAG